MFISPAYAQAVGGGDAGGLITFMPIILIFVVFYFLLIRPQQKKMKQHRSMVDNLRRGDRVVTGGGLIGTVTKVVSDTELQVELADGVRVRVVRGTVQDVLAKTEPAKGKKGEAANDDQKAAPAGEAKGVAALGKFLGFGPKK